MKNLIVRSLLAATLLSAFTSPAELLIYKGVEKETRFGNGDKLSVNWKVIVIIDHDSGSFSRINYATIRGPKRYVTFQHTNSHIVQVIGLDGKMQTAITRIPTDCDASEFPGNEGIYLKGPNATLSLDKGTTISFPKTLSENGMGLSHTSSSNQPYITEGSFLLVFNQAETLSSNQAGETLDAAFARLVASVEALGYLR